MRELIPHSQRLVARGNLRWNLGKNDVTRLVFVSCDKQRPLFATSPIMLLSATSRLLKTQAVAFMASLPATCESLEPLIFVISKRELAHAVVHCLGGSSLPQLPRIRAVTPQTARTDCPGRFMLEVLRVLRCVVVCLRIMLTRVAPFSLPWKMWRTSLVMRLGVFGRGGVGVVGAGCAVRFYAGLSKRKAWLPRQERRQRIWRLNQRCLCTRRRETALTANVFCCSSGTDRKQHADPNLPTAPSCTFVSKAQTANWLILAFTRHYSS